MSVVKHEPRIDLATLRATIQSVEPAALLIEPRILRRVIKQDRRLAGLGFQVPHRKAFTIQRDRLLVIADRPELDLAPGDDLPKKVILLAHPTDGDYLENAPADEVLYAYWRLLFHSRVHLWLEQQIAAGELDEADILQRRREIGSVEFEEIRAVLTRDDMLISPSDDRDVFIEFVAVYLELKYFAPHELEVYFPAIRDWQVIDRLVSEDVDHERLYRETRLPGAATQSRGARLLQQPSQREPSPEPEVRDPLQPSPPRFWRMMARAERARVVGNGVRAAILCTRARRLALPERAAELEETAQAELRRVVDRLGAALDLPNEIRDRWLRALLPLLDRAAQDRWSAEARLLYDLQKVCIESERGVYRVDLWRWLRTWGRRSLRTPLPLLRQVLITKHLRTAARRLSTLRVDAASRERLGALLDDAFDRMETMMRIDLRPRIAAVLDSVGLIPRNVPERVARRKVIEELLDRIVVRGFVNMGDLRDALSKNNLKLPDLSGLREAITGDQLLRADRLLAHYLEGVYRPGTVYQRVPQSLSSVAFGHSVGRFLTQFVFLPFGGAYVALAGLWHLGELLVHLATDLVNAPVEKPATAPRHSPFRPDPVFLTAVLALGTLLLLLIHRPRFRRAFFRAVVQVFSFLKHVLIDWPARILRSPFVQRILQSQFYGVVHSYLIRPLVFSSLVLLPTILDPEPMDWNLALNVFLALDLFLNSPIGRYADERFTDMLVRAWHELRMRVIAAIFQWIMDMFHQLLETLERILYMVDEWLCFRVGDSRMSLAIKLAFSPLWSFFRYFIRLIVTLLIEPQVNPIKHFPVVTVSHKIILPFQPMVAASLIPLFGRIMGQSLAAAIVLLLPGVFGFLVWELKENWRLYVANRSPNLRPSRIGHHGETMVALLRPGFHSGTLPKLFTRLRKACRQAGETGDWKPVNQRRASLAQVEESVRHFFDREFCALLEEENTFAAGPVWTGTLRLANNRIDVEFVADNATNSVWLAIEECGGWLTASIRQRGWLATLRPDELHIVEAALAGVYKLAGIDLIRERIDAELAPRAAWYEITDAGIAVYKNGSPAHRVIYPLRRERARIAPRGDAQGGRQDWPALNRKSLIFADSPIDWNRWVEFWQADKRSSSRVPFTTGFEETALAAS